MMAGIPASGKSLIASWLGDTLGVTVISADSIRAEIAGDEAHQFKDREVWALLHERARQAVQSNKSIIIDATHNHYAGRLREIKEYRSYGAKKMICININTKIEDAISRNRSRERVVDEYHLHRMLANITKNPPSIEDGFDAIVTIDN